MKVKKELWTQNRKNKINKLNEQIDTPSEQSRRVRGYRESTAAQTAASPRHRSARVQVAVGKSLPLGVMWRGFLNGYFWWLFLYRALVSGLSNALNVSTS